MYLTWSFSRSFQIESFTHFKLNSLRFAAVFPLFFHCLYLGLSSLFFIVNLDHNRKWFNFNRNLSEIDQFSQEMWSFLIFHAIYAEIMKLPSLPTLKIKPTKNPIGICVRELNKSQFSPLWKFRETSEQMKQATREKKKQKHQRQSDGDNIDWEDFT